MSLPRLAEVHAFREVVDGKKVLTFGSERIDGRDLLLSVSLDMPIEAVLAEVKDLFKAYRWSDRLDRGLERKEVDYDLKASVTRIQKDEEIAFKPSKESGRAIGLWLWDYLGGQVEEADDGGKIKAIKAVMEVPGFDRLGFAESEERMFYRLLEKTDICIKKGRVASMGYVTVS